MKYEVQRNIEYDFLNQSYSNIYPNLHRYPATMLPQIGIKLLKDFNIKNGNLLDPYCGSGSSFASAIESGIKNMHGYDLNPLAILISKAKFTKVSLKNFFDERNNIINKLSNFSEDYLENKFINPPVTNINYWFSQPVIKKLNIIKYYIDNIKNSDIRDLFLLAFSESVRETSFTRNNEFKLYRINEQQINNFKPDVFDIFTKKIINLSYYYSNFYYPNLKNELNIKLKSEIFKPVNNYYDTVLTSPPYGDSRTTVAYGQFSTLSNEWLGINFARKIDRLLMGGNISKELYSKGLIYDYIQEIKNISHKRALEISSFYFDLEKSIIEVSKSLKKGGKVFYVVGNRTVKNIQLPTDQFIAEKFEENNMNHIITLKRAISNKSMPSKNSPSNQIGKKVNTMLYEYIVICEK